MDRILVAKAIGRTPSSSQFRLLLSSSIKYGLTEGSEKADKVSPLTRAREIFRPVSDAEKLKGIRDAVFEPELCKKILEHYSGSSLPRDDFFKNVLEREFDVPAEHTGEFAELIFANAEFAQILEDVSGKKYVMLSRTPASVGPSFSNEHDNEPRDDESAEVDVQTDNDLSLQRSKIDVESQQQKTRVFISHGKDRGMLENVKEMLGVAGLEYEVAVESESTAIPVPEKIKEAMRRCNAALICVSDENGDGSVNQNVLIEIGAAFVLYDKQVVLLWDKSLAVPSNLQGLYRCEVEGTNLSFAHGMKLMATLKNFQSSQ
ncbi:MAG: nucleotide-binding protein [Phycisphaerales bacterium]|nr:nucleotide-binding protein [Phycisphaerales bacterium]